MAPRRIPLPAGAAFCPADPEILLEGHSDDDVLASHTGDLTARAPNPRNVFQDLGTEHAIERTVRKIESGHVACDCYHAGIFKRRLNQV
jgi:hypothetical protein